MKNRGHSFLVDFTAATWYDCNCWLEARSICPRRVFNQAQRPARATIDWSPGT